MLTVIQTNYKGYRFRSRTEARWAVFFDAYNLAWRYEMEGFELPSGNFLPDFFLPQWKCFVEIKGSFEEALKVHDKCRDLRDASGFPVLLIAGQPNHECCTLFCWDTNHGGGAVSEWWASFITTYDCELAMVPCYDDGKPAWTHSFCDGNWETLEFINFNSGNAPADYGYLMAKEARFGVWE